MFTDFDRQMMARALQLARRALYTTDPNPRVDETNSDHQHRLDPYTS